MAVGDVSEEIGVSAVASEGLRPRGAPAEHQGALDGSVEGRGVGPAVVVVIDGERTHVVSAIRDRDGVAIFLPRGEGEVTESLLLRVTETQGLGDNGGSSAAEEAVRKPNGVEWIGGVGGSAAVYVVRNLCLPKKQKNAVSGSQKVSQIEGG